MQRDKSTLFRGSLYFPGIYRRTAAKIAEEKGRLIRVGVGQREHKLLGVASDVPCETTLKDRTRDAPSSSFSSPARTFSFVRNAQTVSILSILFSFLPNQIRSRYALAPRYRALLAFLQISSKEQRIFVFRNRTHGSLVKIQSSDRYPSAIQFPGEMS